MGCTGGEGSGPGHGDFQGGQWSWHSVQQGDRRAQPRDARICADRHAAAQRMQRANRHCGVLLRVGVRRLGGHPPCADDPWPPQKRPGGISQASSNKHSQCSFRYLLLIVILQTQTGGPCAILRSISLPRAAVLCGGR